MVGSCSKFTKNFFYECATSTRKDRSLKLVTVFHIVFFSLFVINLVSSLIIAGEKQLVKPTTD